MSIPNEFLCPITLEIMTDPVICEDGYSYEKKSIYDWLERSVSSPMTREPISKDRIQPNESLKKAIDSWLENRSFKREFDKKDFDNISLETVSLTTNHTNEHSLITYQYPIIDTPHNITIRRPIITNNRIRNNKCLLIYIVISIVIFLGFIFYLFLD